MLSQPRQSQSCTPRQELRLRIFLTLRTTCTTTRAGTASTAAAGKISPRRAQMQHTLPELVQHNLDTDDMCRNGRMCSAHRRNLSADKSRQLTAAEQARVTPENLSFPRRVRDCLVQHPHQRTATFQQAVRTSATQKSV